MEATQLLAKSTRAAVHMLAGYPGSGPSKCSVYEETQSLFARNLIQWKKQTIKMYVRSQ